MATPKFYSPPAKQPAKPRKFFTLAEANRSLPLVRRVVRDIVAAHRQATDMQAKLESAGNIRDTMAIQNQLEAAVDRLQDYVEELEAIGVALKDYEAGLIDFPGRHRGRQVCLCWRLGEERIEYWHDMQAGFAGRQPINTLSENV